MFLFRVLVGEYCQGRKDVKAPDGLDAATNQLYDTTVDSAYMECPRANDPPIVRENEPGCLTLYATRGRNCCARS